MFSRGPYDQIQVPIERDLPNRMEHLPTSNSDKFEPVIGTALAGSVRSSQ
jgi:hypothetical protein